MSVALDTPPIPYASAQIPPPPDRLLPLPEIEPRRVRWVWLGMAIVFCLLYFVALLRFWAPGDGGIDQNAYLTGGRMIAEHFSPRLVMHNDYQYVGGMFIRTPTGNYYPKYPFGLPFVYACFFWTLGPNLGPVYAFLVSPVATVLSILGMFLLARTIAGSYAAMLAAILLGTSQVTLLLANNPNSHALCMACIVWGMFLLVRWWQTGAHWRGLLAGFLLGYACLVRYSEGLLILPIAVACLSRVRWSQWRSYIRCALPGLAWAVPVLTLLLFNHHTLGTWTGYDATNESEAGAAFTWDKFDSTWEEMLRTFYDVGLFFVLPFGIAGLFMLYRRSWQLATTMLLWLIPGTALYTAYYWSPERGISYARFFLTFLPALLVGAAVCFHDGIFSSARGEHPLRKIPLILAAGVIVLISAGVGTYRAFAGMYEGQANAMPGVYEEYRQREVLAVAGGNLLDKVPRDSVLFCDEGYFNNSPVNYVEFLRRWDVFSLDAFTSNSRRNTMIARLFNPGGGGPGGGQGGGGRPRDPIQDPNSQGDPRPVQRAQIEHLAALYQDKSAKDLLTEEFKVVNDALQAGHRVFVIASPPRAKGFARDFDEDKYTIVPVARWTDVGQVGPADDATTAADNPARNRARLFGGQGGGRGNGGGNNGPGGPGRYNPADIPAFSLLEIQLRANPPH